MKDKIGRMIEADWRVEINTDPSADQLSGGSVALGNQDRNSTHERRTGVRFALSKSPRTTALVWRRSADVDALEAVSSDHAPCTLVDISAGGAQVVIDMSQAPSFRKGQYVILRFSPAACVMPINFDALIREVLPTADSEHSCLGLQFVGLEANPEGRVSLQRLCESEGRFFESLANGTESHPASKPPISPN